MRERAGRGSDQQYNARDEAGEKGRLFGITGKDILEVLSGAFFEYFRT